MPAPVPPLAGLLAWLRPEEVSALGLENGALVERWDPAPDSPRGATYVPDSDLNAWIEAGGNGLGAVRFASNAYLLLDDPVDVTEELTIYGAMQLNYTGAQSPVAQLVGAITPSQSRASLGRTGMFFTADPYTTNFAGTIPSGVVHRVRFRFGGRGADFAFNGESLGAPVPCGTFQVETLGLMQGGGAATREISELLVYNRLLTAQEDADVLAYLTDRYV